MSLHKPSKRYYTVYQTINKTITNWPISGRAKCSRRRNWIGSEGTHPSIPIFWIWESIPERRLMLSGSRTRLLFPCRSWWENRKKNDGGATVYVLHYNTPLTELGLVQTTDTHEPGFCYLLLPTILLQVTIHRAATDISYLVVACDFWYT